MTVQELIEKLKCMPHDARVILSCDMEGNRASPVDDVTIESYRRIALVPLKNEVGDLLCEEDSDDDDERPVVLWPLA